MIQLYDSIGSSYAVVRRPDPAWQAEIARRIGSAESVVNVGAGTGSYEPQANRTVAVEPSMTMIRQRAPSSAPAVQARAEALPLRGGSFATAMSVLSVHHWASRPAAFAEIGRVTRDKAVFVTWDPAHDGFWLTEDYFPEIVAIDRAIFPQLSEFRRAFGSIEVFALPVPHDCMDGFLGAYWRRPTAYLDAPVRAGMSTFARIGGVESGLARLAAELDSGAWLRKHGAVLDETGLDLGYRIVVAAL